MDVRFNDGKACTLLMNVAPLRDDQDRARGAVAVAVDISERKRAEATLRENEAKLREQADQLAEADRHKDAFLALLGHELRNPLAPMRNAIDLLDLATESMESKPAKAMAIVDRQVHHLTRLVDDLLDVARINRDRIRLKREQLDLGELVERVVESLRSMLEHREQHLTVECMAERIHINADSVRISQVLTNLLYNASNYSGEGGNIYVACDHDDEWAQLRVVDDGIGIPKEHLGDIFDPFSRAAAALSEGGKEGLGLG